jgi:hypothetical protein
MSLVEASGDVRGGPFLAYVAALDNLRTVGDGEDRARVCSRSRTPARAAVVRGLLAGRG